MEIHRFCGQSEKVKGADRLPAIFESIRKLLPNTFFIVVGDGPLRGYLKNRLRNLNALFTGNVPQTDVALYMNALDVLVLPSRNEGWPCVVLEAQACGTLVVGSDKGGIPEAVDFQSTWLKVVVILRKDLLGGLWKFS